MPTPRHITQVAAAGRVQQPQAGGSNPRPGTWIRGILASVTTATGDYSVDLDNGRRVAASSSIDDALHFGDRLWVVNAGNEYIIVGLG